jgi:mono/diheme cytochrome c family protein
MRLSLPPRARFGVPLPTGAFLVVVAVFALLKLVRPVIPASVILMYMGFVVAGVIIHITLDDGRIQRFRDFFVGTEGESRAARIQRWGLLAVIPLVLGWWTYGALRPSAGAPVEIVQRHPTAGEEVLGRIVVPEWVEDTANWSAETISSGKAIYDGNCAVCHGENLDGKGLAAEGFRYPIRPANFRDSGTIAQLTLPYVYWRLTTGGIQNQFNSAMPRWVAPPGDADVSTLHTYDLTPDEAWKVIVYLYDETGSVPR